MVQHVDVEETKKLIRSGDAVVIDALPAESYGLRHLPSAVNLTPDDDSFDEKASELIPDKSTTVVTYCSDPECPESGQVAERLEELGYEDVREFDGGLRGWRKAGYDWVRPEQGREPERIQADSS